MAEILKSLWGKIYAWAIPSALAIGVYVLFVHPHTSVGHGWVADASDTEKGVALLVLTAVVAITLNAFSSPLYRILEGYLLWPRWLQDEGMRRQRERKKRLERSVAGSGWRRGLDLEKLALYPKNDEQIVPTRFGNAIRSFETFGKTRYNLDSQSLWYELNAVVPQHIQNEIKEARDSVDFFVAMTYLGAMLGVVAFAVAAYEHFTLPIVVVGVVAVVTAVLCHWLAVRATGEWGYTVRALVNIGRVKLAESMGLHLPDCLEQERVMWGLVTRYGFFGDPSDGTKLDDFRKAPAPRSRRT